MLLDMVSLVGAIVLMVLIVQLRGLAALPFSRVNARFVAASAPSAVADLYATAATELTELGFAPARWALVSSTVASPSPLRAVHVHAQAAAAVWLALPGAQAPHRLNVFFVTRLDDGRMLITQPFDCWFALFEDRCLTQSPAMPTLAEQWHAHCAFVGAHGRADAQAITTEGLLDFNNAWMECQRQQLIASGKLQPVDDDTAVPTLRFAWRLLRLAMRMPKAPADLAPVPPARIALFASRFEQIRQRSPRRSVEITLFAASVALFMALGALLWNASIAWMILVVVVIHELGHFLAMRAFGYRNVHMLALPLVGGVAIGQDVDPSAHRSAWMALMGPLPGIVIGWLLLASAFAGEWPDASSMITWATTFLLINYLNVLPIPPLDGGHVVQALLPPRRAWLEIGFIAIACSAGAWLAWTYDLTLLAVLALFQLFSLSARLRSQRALAALALSPPSRALARPFRLRAVAEALERTLGPAPIAKVRIEQTLEVLQRLDRRPMRAWQAAGVAVTLGALMVVPAAAMVVGVAFGGLGGIDGSADAQAAMARAQAVTTGFLAQAKDKSDSELVADLDASLGAAPSQPAATAAALEAAAARLGRPVPPALADLYRLHDGVEALNLAPIAELKTAASAIDELTQEIDLPTVYFDVETDAGDYTDQSIATARLREWLLIGAFEGDLLLFNPDPQAQPVQVLNLWLESPGGYVSVRDWLERRWVAEQSSRHFQQLVADRQTRFQRELQQADWPRLLAALDPPLPLAYRLLVDQPDAAAPASAASISAAEARLGHPLPPEYRELLALHDGVQALQLGSLAQVQVLDAETVADSTWMRELPRSTLAGVHLQAEAITLESGAQLSGCWSLGRNRSNRPGRLVYCPPGHALSGVIDLNTMARHADLRAYAIVRAAQVMASANPMVE
jgi:Zn-dependent protease/cell wall assembly regulator SMI1